MKKVNEEIVTTLAGKAGKWKPRYIAHYLFGDSRGDAIVLWIMTHIWRAVGVFFLGATLHEIPYDSSFPTAPKIGIVLMSLASYLMVLVFDLEIMAELRSFFQNYFLAGNMLVQGICTAAMYWELDPLYAVLLILCYIPLILTGWCLDAYPFHLFGKNQIFKFLSLSGAIGSEFFIWIRIFFVKFTQMPNGDVFDPVLFGGTHVETKLSSIVLSCTTNIRFSNFWVVLSL